MGDLECGGMGKYGRGGLLIGVNRRNGRRKRVIKSEVV